MTDSILNSRIYRILYQWRFPILAGLGVGFGVGIAILSYRIWKKQIMDQKEIVYEKEADKKKPYKILILGLNDSGKSGLLAMLTHQEVAKMNKTDGFHSVTVKPQYCKCPTPINFIEVSGLPESRKYWDKFTISAGLIFVVVDLGDTSSLNDLCKSLSCCLPEAKKNGIEIYFVFNKKAETPEQNIVDSEKFFCLEGLVNEPKQEIISVSLDQKRGIDKIESIIKSNFD